MPKINLTMFTRVSVNLFRLGNASGPRLDKIRPVDVDIFEKEFSDGTTKQMVKDTGGISTFDRINPNLKGTKWWKIPKDTPLADTIRIIKDQTDPRSGITHYSLRPAREMTLLEFAAGLKDLAANAQPVPTAEGTKDESKAGKK